MNSRVRIAGATLAAATLLLTAGNAPAEVATALLREGDAIPAAGVGHFVNSLNNTAVNHVGGYAVNINSSDGSVTLSHIWGNAAGGAGGIMRTEGTFGPLVQTAYESFYGMADDGSVAYSCTGTGGPVGSFDSVWLNDTPIMVEGDPYPHTPGLWWRFGSRPGVSANGIPYFVGGTATTQGGSTSNRGLFRNVTANPVFMGGDVLPNLPVALGTGTTVSFDYRFSALANHHIAEVQLTGATSADAAMVVDGAGLILGGTLVREGNVVPLIVGGNGVEKWTNFDFTGITETGHWFFTGDTDASPIDEFIVKNGVIAYQEGQILDGQTITGTIEHAYMNEDGDLAFIWSTVDSIARSTLFVNDRMILRENQPVDLDGDGIIEPTSILRSFTGISMLTLSDRDGTGAVYAYFTGDVDINGTPSTTDDVEGFFCTRVDVAPTAVQLSGLTATPSLRSPGVVLSWTTSMEQDHQGFHVYRSDEINGSYGRLTESLITGSSPYQWIDTSARPGMRYYYMVGAVDQAGAEVRYGPVEVTTPGRGVRTALAPAEPNPFTQRTQIRFTLDRESPVQLTVVDVAGRKVATLVNQALTPGEHERWWDGRTDDGRAAAAGVYFYRLQTNDARDTRKMVLLRGD